jgi:hypothetical protein
VFLASLALAAIAAALYLGCGAAGPGFAWRGVPLDDVWIHFVYARSIASGHPFQYNPGEWETGSTSPLWAIALAPGQWLPGGGVAFAKLLGLLLAAASAALGHRLATRLGFARAAWVFAAALLLTPYLAFASVSGSEVGLFAALVIAAAVSASEDRPALAGVATGLAILARPEGFLLVPLLFAAFAWPRGDAEIHHVPRRASAPGREPLVRTLPRALAAAGIALACVLPWLAYCLFASGRPLSATYYAKAVGGALGLLEPSQYAAAWALLADQPMFGGVLPGVLGPAGAMLGAVLLALGLLRLARRDARAFLLAGLGGLALLAGPIASLPLGHLGAADAVGSMRSFYFARYLLPALTPLLLVWAIGLESLATIVLAPVRGGPVRGARAWAAAFALLLALPALGAARGHASLRQVYAWNCRNIEEQQVAAARWIAAQVPSGASVAVSDAGAMRYFGGHRVIDLAGLNSHRLVDANLTLNRLPPGSAEARALADRIWESERPGYLALNQGWHRKLVEGRALTLLRTWRIERNTICGADELVVERTEFGEAAAR